MGSSKKHKEKDRERKKHRRSRSRSRDKEHRKEKHSRGHKSHRERRSKRALEESQVNLNRFEDDVVQQRNDEPEILVDNPLVEAYQDDDVQIVSGEPFKGSGESLSIIETNKLRSKLGLKPLVADDQPTIPGLDGEEEPIPGSSEKNEIFVKTENIAQKLQIEKLREKVAVMREKRKLTQKIQKVKGLGESESDDETVVSWVQKSRKQEIEKVKAAQRAKLLEEMDQEFGIGALVEEEFDSKKNYSSKDLKGLTIGHSQETFQEGKMVILTLKDQGVLETGDEVLENVNLIDDEKAAKNVDIKKKGSAYKPYDEPEYDELGIVKKKTLLSKYDEEIEGVKKETFKLGTAKMSREQEMELIGLRLKQQQNVSLDVPAMRLATEYFTPEEMVSFKKKPKKLRKIRKRFGADDLLQLGAGGNGLDHGSRNPKPSEVVKEEPWDDLIKQEVTGDDMEIDNQLEDIEILGPEEDLTGVAVDDDKAEVELEVALNRARKLKQQEGKMGSVEKLANAMKDKKEESPGSNEVGNIVMNSIAEFCRTLGEIPTYGMSGNREDDEDMMDFDQDTNDDKSEEAARGAWNEVDIDNTPVEIKARENQPILEEEPDVSTGLAGALNLARKKGYLDQNTNKLASITKHSHLEAQSYTIEEKFYEDDKFGRRDRYTGPIQDFREKDSYKPEVKLEYIDDGGRLLNAKEAFRYLSHKFHGKGPGKNKVDKRTKKLDQEGKLKQMSSTDTPLNTLKLLQEKQRDLQTPFILLSGGSKALTGNSIIKSSK